MKKIIPLTLIMAVLIAIYIYFRRKYAYLRDPLYKRIQGVELNGIPWREDIDKRYVSVSRPASKVVEKIVMEIYDNEDSHVEVLGTGKTLHNSEDLAYLIVVNAFGRALEDGLIQLRNF
jgi:hypothetical protein